MLQTKFQNWILWREVEDEDEPPDYFLFLDDTKFSVEITTIVRNINIGNQEKTTTGITAAISNFLNKIEQEVKTDGKLNGKYVAVIPPLSNFSTLRFQMKQSMFKYISKTKNDLEHERKNLLPLIDKKCFIKKVSNEGRSIEEVIDYGIETVKILNNQLDNLIKNRIKVKNSRLENISYPKILLLIDNYNYSKTDLWKESVITSEYNDCFHTIARINGSDVDILQTKIKDWRNQ